LIKVHLNNKDIPDTQTPEINRTLKVTPVDISRGATVAQKLQDTNLVDIETNLTDSMSKGVDTTNLQTATGAHQAEVTMTTTVADLVNISPTITAVDQVVDITMTTEDRVTNMINEVLVHQDLTIGTNTLLEMAAVVITIEAEDHTCPLPRDHPTMIPDVIAPGLDRFRSRLVLWIDASVSVNHGRKSLLHRPALVGIVHQTPMKSHNKKLKELPFVKQRRQEKISPPSVLIS